MFNKNYTTPEELMMELAARNWSDFFSKEILFDALPCLGFSIVSEAVDTCVRRGEMKLVIPRGDGARGTYCHGLRVSNSDLEQFGLKPLTL